MAEHIGGAPSANTAARVGFHPQETETPFPERDMIHEWVERQALLLPDAVAVATDDVRLTFAQLNAEANRWARLLRDKGVLPDQRIAVLLERSAEMIIGIIAILKAGGAYVPIDPAYPQERIDYVLEDSGAFLVLVRDKHAAAGLRGVEAIDLLGDGAAAYPDTNLEPTGTSRNLAYVIYTSGSTGRPKGAMIEHRSVINRLHWMQNRFSLGEHDVILQKTPFSFDVSVWELFWWALPGAKAFFLAPGGERDPETISRAIAKHGVTTLHFVPSMLYVFVDYIEQTGELARLSGLRRVFCSGEALPADLVRRFYALGLEAELVNLYGPTEATVDVSWYICPRSGVPDLVPIGKPIDNIRLYVLGEDGLAQPEGEAGELCIAGVGVARGYLNLPELTDDKFVADPFAAEGRMYRTGDLAKVLPDGDIAYLGRLDHQVKIRGYRIELGEIEARLHAHPAIKEAVVADRSDAGGQTQLCAYVVTSVASVDITDAELKTYLGAFLPAYMVPAYYRRLEAMPLTPNGKLDRKALPGLPEAPGDGTAYTAPRSEREAAVAAMYAEVLGLGVVGAKDHFFERGGHSLKANELKMNIYRTFGVLLPLSDIFAHPTVEALAERLSAAAPVTAWQPLARAPVQAYYPLSEAQKRMYLIHELYPADTIWNMPGCVYLNGPLDTDRLRAAWRSAIERHESLRTSFGRVDGFPVQRIHHESALAWEQADVLSEELDARIAAFIRPFALNETPPVRVGLFRLEAERYLLAVDIHHIVFDGMSIRTLFQDLSDAYNGLKLDEAAVQYKDYAVWEQQWRESECFRREERFWLDVYSGQALPLELPTDFPRPTRRTTEGAQLRRQLQQETVAAIHRLAQATDTTPYMILLACFSILLGKYSGQDDVVIGSFVSGRTHPDTASMVGMFVNTLPMRCFPVKTKTFEAYLQEIKRFTLQAVDHQSYPFAELADALQRAGWEQEWMRAMFTMQNAEPAHIALTGVTAVPYDIPAPYAGYDVTLQAEEHEGQLLLVLNYSTQLFSEGSMERLLDDFSRILDQATDGPQTLLAVFEFGSLELRAVPVVLDDIAFDF